MILDELTSWIIIDKNKIYSYENTKIDFINTFLMKLERDVNVKMSLNCVVHEGGVVFDDTLNRFGRYFFLHKDADTRIAISRCIRDIESIFDNMSQHKKVVRIKSCLVDII